MTTPGTMASRRVAILIVTHNEAGDLPACFEAIRSQTYDELEVVVVDCASQDDSLAVARDANLGTIPVRVVDAGANLGFAGGMNTAVAHTDAPYLLTLNADVRLGPEYIAHLLETLQRDPQGSSRGDSRVGAATGRLLRFSAENGNGSGGPDRLDACGMRLETSWRHLDRGASEVDRGQYMTPERVFGATGAAALFAREALEDVGWPRELVSASPPGAPPATPIFDPDFFTFREDAELAFRLQARGWSVIFDPRATARHRRNNLPERRRSMPALVNYHGVKNRYLLRAYHQTFGNALRTLLPSLWRDLMVVGYVVIAERDSLPAFAWLWRQRRAIRARRRFVQERRRADVDVWFRTDALPVTDPQPVDDPAQRPADAP